jgi:hypothetical protein
VSPRILVQVILGFLVAAAWTALFGLIFVWFVDGVVLLVPYIGVPILVFTLYKKIFWFRLTIFLTTAAVAIFVWMHSFLTAAL